MKADFSCHSTNTNKEVLKNNIFKIELKKDTVHNQNENSTRRNSITNGETFLSNIKSKLKKNTIEKIPSNYVI